MKGFDKNFKDFPDYIIGITKQIWEGRDFTSLHGYYAGDIVMRSPVGLIIGNENVIGDTLATIAQFPDIHLLAEDVIWSGSPEEGMLSSHRIMSTETHLGDGSFGKATGTKLRHRVIADCHAINNQINDEWLIHDQGAVAMQLGWDVADYARDLIDKEGGPGSCARPFCPDMDKAGPYQGRGNDNEWGQKYADMLNRIMNADIASIRTSYDRACQSCWPLNQTNVSYDAIESRWMGLRSSFPDAKFSIEHQVGREDPLMPPRAAIRWSLHGRHDGHGRFGAPSGAEVYVMGISHAEFGPWGLRHEYTLFDEVAIWKQIHLHTGNVT